MFSLLTLLVQISVPLVVGLAISRYLSDAIYHSLTELCGTQDRAGFWLRAITVLFIGTPMALVLLFGHSLSAQSNTGFAALAEIIQRTVGLSLTGILLSVALISRTIWKQIRNQSKTDPAT